MYNQPIFLIHLLNLFELISFVICLLTLNKNNFKNQKWFVLYLFYIIIIEFFNTKICELLGFDNQTFIAYLSIPIEFLFFIWLFAFQSLKNKKLYIICTIVYLLSFIPDYSLEKGKYYFNSFNYLIGAFILLYLILLELIQQIKSDEILFFQQNKMFYVTIGVGLFYIGNLPFFGLYYLILQQPDIWNYYYIFFMITNCIMYLLFAASFVWGKPKP